MNRFISDVTLVIHEDEPPAGAQASAVPADTVEEAMNQGRDE